MKSLLKNEKVSIALAAIGIVVVVGIYMGLWELNAILLSIAGVIIAGIGGVLVWGFKKRIMKPGEQDTQNQTVARRLIDHSNDIIFGYKRFEYERVRLTGYTLEEYLQGFRYRKELLQHLLTGHKEVYDVLNKTIESEKSYRETYNSIINKVGQRVREEAQKLSIPENPIKNQHPEFDGVYSTPLS